MQYISNTAITVESEAKDINKKNKAPHICPPAIETNTLGKVIKIKTRPTIWINTK